MLEDRGGDVVVGMRGEAGIADPGDGGMAVEVGGERAGVVQVRLHARREGLETARDGIQVRRG